MDTDIRGGGKSVSCILNMWRDTAVWS